MGNALLRPAAFVAKPAQVEGECLAQVHTPRQRLYESPPTIPEPSGPSEEAMRLMYADAAQSLVGDRLAADETADLPKVACGGSYL